MQTRRSRWKWGLMALWLLTFATALLVQSWLFEMNFWASLASIPLILILGVGLLGLLLATKSWRATLILVTGTVLVGALPLNALGHRTWTKISFGQHRPAYETIISHSPVLPAHGTIGGESYIRDRGRVAFPRSQRVPDGWSGVVYDLTNTLPLSDNPGIFAFGSNIQSCIRIERNWYRCWFD